MECEIMKLLKKYKWFIVGFFILFAILVIYICKDFFLSSEGPLYGHRLEGIENVSLTATNKTDISKYLLGESGVKKVDVSVQGKILYVVMFVDESITIDKVKEILTASLDKLSTEQKNFYDISFLVDYDKKTDANNFPISGYKNKNNSNIVW
jgi:hypothetical protein